MSKFASKILNHKKWLDTHGNDGVRLEVFDGEFEDLELTGIDLFSVAFPGTLFKNCIIRRTNLNKSNLASVIFENCDLSETTFRKSNLDYASFFNCKLRHTSFFKSTLYEAKFVNTNLDSVDFLNAYTLGMTTT